MDEIAPMHPVHVNDVFKIVISMGLSKFKKKKIYQSDLFLFSEGVFSCD